MVAVEEGDKEAHAMNYYRRYIGDYGRDTTLLSLAEHGAYALLLDHYYASEEPLPADREDVYRVARAVKPDERKAVDRVLAKYFTEEPDGFHNSRADAELDRAQPAIEAAKRNGSKGGRPPKTNPTGYEEETQRVSYADNPTGLDTPPETEPTGKAIRAGDPTTNHHPPTASHQPPALANASASPSRKSQRKPAKAPLPPDFGISTRVEAWATEKGHARLPEHLEAFKAKCRANGYTYADWDSAFMEAIRQDWAQLSTPKPSNGFGAHQPSPAAHSTAKADAAIADGKQALANRVEPPPELMRQFARKSH